MEGCRLPTAQPMKAAGCNWFQKMPQILKNLEIVRTLTTVSAGQGSRFITMQV